MLPCSVNSLSFQQTRNALYDMSIHVVYHFHTCQTTLWILVSVWYLYLLYFPFFRFFPHVSPYLLLIWISLHKCLITLKLYYFNTKDDEHQPLAFLQYLEKMGFQRNLKSVWKQETFLTLHSTWIAQHLLLRPLTRHAKHFIEPILCQRNSSIMWQQGLMFK